MKEFDECVRNGKLKQYSPPQGMVEKEMEGAGYDLRRARDSLLSDDPKWASIQAYYSMFHCARALLLRKGYREKSHYCIIVGLKELYVGPGLLDPSIVVDLEDAMLVRHDADYGLMYDEAIARMVMKKAEVFYLRSKEVLEG